MCICFKDQSAFIHVVNLMHALDSEKTLPTGIFNNYMYINMLFILLIRINIAECTKKFKRFLLLWISVLPFSSVEDTVLGYNSEMVVIVYDPRHEPEGRARPKGVSPIPTLPAGSTNQVPPLATHTPRHSPVPKQRWVKVKFHLYHFPEITTQANINSTLVENFWILTSMDFIV